MKLLSFLRNSGGFISNRESFDFYDAEILTVWWETKPDIIEKLLPPPLKPLDRSIVFAIVADYPKTNFGLIYKEGALFLACEFEGVEGFYCLAMPVTNDMALAAGREIFGYPKKIASIHLQREKRNLEGWIERHGIRFFKVKAKINGRPNSSDFIQLAIDRTGGDPGKDFSFYFYNYKHFPAPDGKFFDYHPRLVREEIVFRPTELKLGNAEITLNSSNNDPWSELAVDKILGAVYIKGNNSMLRGSVVAELEPEKFVQYSFLKWDIEI